MKAAEHEVQRKACSSDVYITTKKGLGTITCMHARRSLRLTVRHSRTRARMHPLKRRSLLLTLRHRLTRARMHPRKRHSLLLTVRHRRKFVRSKAKVSSVRSKAKVSRCSKSLNRVIIRNIILIILSTE